ncbi:MAG: hypothetical protein FWD44_05105 [Oscillospiraceae bacterium]|nr:hypothetical protein [Oscillospiraceae bacterium]
MDSNKARELLTKLGAEQDTEILSNDKEYYFKKDYPVFSFSVPKSGVLSRAKWFKLIQLSEKIIKHKRGEIK